MSLINVKDLCLGYEGKNVVENLNFFVNEGDYLCILGENGSGKSTLIKALLGLKKVNSGKIVFGDGLEKNKIGYLPQQAPVQKDFPASVFEVVLTGCLGRKNPLGIYSRRDKRKALENMAILGITELKSRCYRTLSGGQRQRVLLARALCSAGTLILLDEPVTGLDPTATAEMYDLLYHLNAEHKIGVIMVSHDVEASVKYAGKVLYLKESGYFFGETKEFLQTDEGKRLYGNESVK